MEYADPNDNPYAPTIHFQSPTLSSEQQEEVRTVLQGFRHQTAVRALGISAHATVYGSALVAVIGIAIRDENIAVMGVTSAAVARVLDAVLLKIEKVIHTRIDPTFQNLTPDQKKYVGNRTLKVPRIDKINF